MAVDKASLGGCQVSAISIKKMGGSEMKITVKMSKEKVGKTLYIMENRRGRW